MNQCASARPRFRAFSLFAGSRRRILRTLSVIGALLALTTSVAPARQTPGGTPPPAARPAEPIPPDFAWAPWDSLLGRYVRNGLVDYGAWKKAGTADLDHLLKDVAAWGAYEKATREQKMAFLINAYNALTIRQVLEHYPVAGVKDVDGFFTDFRHPLPGGAYTLDDIEKTLLKTLAGREDPAWHFGLVCASRGCPPLSDRAYRAETLPADLGARARLFLADSAKARYEEEGHVLHVSELLRWHQGDFEFGDYTLVRWLAPYFSLGIAMQFARSEPEVRFLDFDWQLNDAAPEQ